MGGRGEREAQSGAGGTVSWNSGKAVILIFNFSDWTRVQYHAEIPSLPTEKLPVFYKHWLHETAPPPRRWARKIGACGGRKEKGGGGGNCFASIREWIEKRRKEEGGKGEGERKALDYLCVSVCGYGRRGGGIFFRVELGSAED